MASCLTVSFVHDNGLEVNKVVYVDGAMQRAELNRHARVKGFGETGFLAMIAVFVECARWHAEQSGQDRSSALVCRWAQPSSRATFDMRTLCSVLLAELSQQTEGVSDDPAGSDLPADDLENRDARIGNLLAGRGNAEQFPLVRALIA